MKRIVGIAFCLCMIPGMALAQQASLPQILKPDKYAEWGDISFSNEKIHLDKIADQAKEWPLSITYLVIHAGRTACVDEAKARGIRAKNYLVSSGIEEERVVWIDAGWRKNLAVEVWIWPPQMGKPDASSDLDIKRSQVKIQRNCKISARGR
jgi:hypothetical protein